MQAGAKAQRMEKGIAGLLRSILAQRFKDLIGHQCHGGEMEQQPLDN
jgi:hypothetical protein